MGKMLLLQNLVRLCCSDSLLSLQIFPEQSLDVNTNSYYNLPICAAMILLGCFLLFALLRKMPWHPVTLTALGRNTLVFYVFHTIVYTVFLKLGIVFPATWWGGIVGVLAVCGGCTVIAAVLNRILPEAVGKKRNSKLATNG